MSSVVVDRHGVSHEVDFNKITTRLSKLLSEEEHKHINVIQVAQKTIQAIYPNITTQELDIISANTCASLVSTNPWYGILGGRILASNLRKNLEVEGLKTFTQKMEYLYKNVTGYIKDDFIYFIVKNANKIDKMIVKSRDYDIDYFGFKTLEKSYLFKVGKKIVETPQDMFMRVAVNIHYRTKDNGTSKHDVFENIKNTYDYISQKYFIHATPTLFNSGTNFEQQSSCFLLGTHDSLDGIFKTLSDCARISKWAGGIGVHVSNIRSSGARIRSTNGESTGIIPMLKVYNDVARYINQCFVPETMIYTSEGTKMIKDIKIGDKVLTSDGTFRAVMNVIENDKKEDILVIRPKSSIAPLECTNVHEIYALTDQKLMMNFNFIKDRLEQGTIKPDFVEAKNLTKGDFMVYPIPQDIEDDNDEISEDDCRFYGIMIGDGHITQKKCNSKECGVTLGYAKEDTLEWFKKYLEGKNIHYWENKFESNCVQVKFTYNDEKMAFKYDELYNDNREKIISSRFINLPNKKIIKVIKGMMETDGSVGHELYYTTTSKNVMENMRYLFLRLGIPTSGCEKNNIGKISPYRNIITKKICYDIRIPKENVLCEEIGIEPSKKFGYFKWNGMIFNRIRSIEHKPYEGKVYDLTIEDNHNYTTNCGLVHNSGKRNGSIAVYLEPWHGDVMEFLELRLNTGPEELRARDLFLAMWIPDLFMKRVKENGDWYLMNPDECQGLQDVIGEEFEYLYNKYVAEGKYTKKIEAGKVWEKIMISQIETGVPYIGFKDNVNRKSNQINVGIVKSSNLCIEICEVSSHDSYAVCNLASICVNRFLKPDGTYDWDTLHRVAKLVTFNLNQVIDNNYYPTPETKENNFANRPIGIGIQGLADLFCKLKLPFESEEAIKMDADIMETIYHGAVEMSTELAEKYGPYPNFEGSPFSKGILQFEMCGVTPRRYDWSELKEKVKKGMRNSLLTALMPTATTSQIQGHTECFEPVTSNIYTRKTMAGNFMVANKYLIEDLKELNLWDMAMKNDIIDHRGSIQNIERIPQNIRDVYKTAWEIKQRAVIDHAVARSPYVDQSQSMNLFMAVPTYEKITSALFYAWHKGLKTGCYYLRSLPAVAPQQFSQEVKKANNEKKEEALFCSLANPEACTMCSS